MERFQDFDALRDRAEGRMKARLEQLSERSRLRLLAAVDAFGSLEAIPARIWAAIQQDAEDSLFWPMFWAIGGAFLIVVVSLRRRNLRQFRDELLRDKARAQARRYGRQMVEGLKKRLAEAAAAPPTEPDPPARPGEIIAGIPARPTDRIIPDPAAERAAAQKKAIDDLLQGRGAANVHKRDSITETTESISTGTIEATEAYKAENPHQRVALIWRVRKTTGDNRPGYPADESVCPICAPLDGMPEELWAEFTTAPPGPHYGCRCELQVYVTMDVPAGFGGIRADRDRRPANLAGLRALAVGEHCGANAAGGGGFQPGNTCAKGGGVSRGREEIEFPDGVVIQTYRNPTAEQAKAWLEKHGELRGLVDKHTGDLFIWKAHTATHEQFADRLGLKWEDVTSHDDGRFVVKSPGAIESKWSRIDDYRRSKSNGVREFFVEPSMPAIPV